MSRRIPINGNVSLRQVINDVLGARVRPQDIDVFGTQQLIPTPHEVVHCDDGTLILVHAVENRDPMEGGSFKDEDIHLSPEEQSLIRAVLC